MPASVAVGSNPAPLRVTSGVPSTLTVYGWFYNANATNGSGLGSPLAVLTLKSNTNYLAQFAADTAGQVVYFDDTTGNVNQGGTAWANAWVFVAIVRTASATLAYWRPQHQSFLNVVSNSFQSGTPSAVYFGGEDDQFSASCVMSECVIAKKTLSQAEVLAASLRTKPAPFVNAILDVRTLHAFDLKNRAPGRATIGEPTLTASAFSSTGINEPVPRAPRRLPFWWVNTAGGTNTPMTVSVTQTQTPSLIRGVGATKSLTETQTPSFIRALARSLSLTSTQTPSATKNLARAAAISATSTQAPSIAKNVGRPVSLTQTQTPTRGAFALGLVRSLAQTQAVTLIRGLGRNVSATQLQTISLVRAIARTISATETQSIIFIKGLAHFVNVNATQTQTIAIVRAIGRTISRTQTQTPTVGPRALSRLVSAVQAQAVTLQRGIARTISVTQSGAPSVTSSGGGGHVDHPMTVLAFATQLPVVTWIINRLTPGLIRVAISDAPVYGLAIGTAPIFALAIADARVFGLTISDSPVWELEVSSQTGRGTMSTVYELGEQVRLPATFTRKSDGTAVDPTTVTVQTISGGGLQTDHVYGVDSAVIKDSVGNYHFDFVPSGAGQWRYRWVGSGAVNTAKPGSFTVNATPFAGP